MLFSENRQLRHLDYIAYLIAIDCYRQFDAIYRQL